MLYVPTVIISDEFLNYLFGCGFFFLANKGMTVNVIKSCCRSKMIPLTLWMALALTVMLITFFLFSLALNGILYAAIPLLGICYGILYAIMVPTASKLFGLKHFGLIYSSTGLDNPTGALLVSGLLAGYAYDAEAAKQDSWF
jgi:hypothetical protein